MVWIDKMHLQEASVHAKFLDPGNLTSFVAYFSLGLQLIVEMGKPIGWAVVGRASDSGSGRHSLWA